MPSISIIDEFGTTFSFDAVREYSLNSSVTVTDHPVELRGSVSDHAQKLPKTLSFRGVVTETPYDYKDRGNGGQDRVVRALAFLDSIAGNLVTVVAEVFGTFENMALVRYPTTRTDRLKLEFDCEFKQVLLAEAGLVSIPPEATSAPAMADEAETGEQAPQSASSTTAVGSAAETGTTEAEQEEADKSSLLEILEAMGAEP